jgi:hypothetical protein
MDRLCVVQHGLGLFQRLFLAVLLVFGAQFVVELGALAAELFHGFLRLLLETFFFAVQVVKTAGNFAHHFDVRHLVFADRHLAGAVDQHVSGLQQRIAEEAVGCEVFAGQLLDLVLVGRHAFEPAQRRGHRQQQVQFGVLGHARLDEQVACEGSMPAASQSITMSQVLRSMTSGHRSAWSAHASRPRRTGTAARSAS